MAWRIAGSLPIILDDTPLTGWVDCYFQPVTIDGSRHSLPRFTRFVVFCRVRIRSKAMIQGLPRTLVKLLMAAAMLAWSVAPPPIQHRHDGGTDLSHHHDCDDAGYGRPDRSPQGYCASDVGKPHALIFAPEGIGGEASHLHFQWLGFRVTLPDGDSPTDKSEDRCSSKQLFVQARRASIPQACSSGTFDASQTVLPLNTIATDAGASHPPLLCSLLRLTSHPLCDRARHERSGVLLA